VSAPAQVPRAAQPAAASAGPSQRSAELALAVLCLALAALVVWDSLRLGASWADDGPQAGYFPFYVGLLIGAAGLFNGVRALRTAPALCFADWAALRRVASVLVPTALFAALIGWLGIYAASLVFVAFFMRALGGYSWWAIAAVAGGQGAFFYALFELWFQLPLPKGPLEALLGLG
jgi:putative tricarboxylic transport membrane protein